MNTKIIYLHGFTSGAKSNKGVFFQEKIRAEFGIEVLLPDLNLPSFEKLRLSAQIEHVESLLTEKTILIGSSLGGLIAAILAEKHPNQVSHIVTLAAAFNFVSRREADLGSEFLAHWKKSGSIEVDHYYYNEKRQLHFGILDDGRPYEKEKFTITQPILCIHGKNDESVDFKLSEKYLGSQSNVEMYLVNDDHALMETREFSWQKVRAFLANAINN